MTDSQTIFLMKFLASGGKVRSAYRTSGTNSRCHSSRKYLSSKHRQTAHGTCASTHWRPRDCSETMPNTHFHRPHKLCHAFRLRSGSSLPKLELKRRQLAPLMNCNAGSLEIIRQLYRSRCARNSSIQKTNRREMENRTSAVRHVRRREK